MSSAITSASARSTSRATANHRVRTVFHLEPPQVAKGKSSPASTESAAVQPARSSINTDLTGRETRDTQYSASIEGAEHSRSAEQSIEFPIHRLGGDELAQAAELEVLPLILLPLAEEILVHRRWWRKVRREIVELENAGILTANQRLTNSWENTID